MKNFEIHIYQHELKSSAPVDGFDLLSPSEKTQALRFVFEKDRVRYIQTRSELRRLCAHYLNQAPHMISINYAEHGKPFIPDSALKFNVSHSHERALYIFAWDKEVGIDVEYMQDQHDLKGIASRFFSLTEQALLNELPPEQFKQGFYTIWTRKEAYIKANGMGLSHSLSDFSVNLTEPAEFLYLPPGEKWQLMHIPVDGAYRAAYVIQI